MKFIPLVFKHPRHKPRRFCCEAMRAACNLRPPVIFGYFGTKDLGLPVFNAYVPGGSYRYLPRVAIRHCPWCGKLVNRWWDKEDSRDFAGRKVTDASMARQWSARAKNAGVHVPLPPHACAWMRAHLSIRDTYIVYAAETGVLLPRFSTKRAGGRLTGWGVPIWYCPHCGKALVKEPPAATALSRKRRLPKTTTHPRYSP
jgi:endogenous inhibitor of DNA gyrase (YacG/DUF329 family)